MAAHRVQIVEQRSGDWYLREKYGNNEVGRKSEGYSDLSGARRASRRDFPDLPVEVLLLPRESPPVENPPVPPPENDPGYRTGDAGDEDGC